MLEIINRLPTNEHMRPHIDAVTTFCMKMIQTDNEEMVLICIRIVTELTKHFRPAHNPIVSTSYLWGAKAPNMRNVFDFFRAQFRLGSKKVKIGF